MITLVIFINVGIALLCGYFAWQVWQVRNTLAAVADAILEWEHNTHGVLDPNVTPANILQGQQGIAQAREGYAQLQRQLQQLQRLLALLGGGTQLLRSFGWRRRRGARSRYRARLPITR
ncbi:MAG: hypothetical protein O2890_05780 [Cyanobacteria bacterium]|nr:hypothetical protein [Cyanobacteriota bacterium]MDA0865917.1 hypothetical protein [Cyanobacteriota bacterium]